MSSAFGLTRCNFILVVQEIQQQKATLTKQREDYVKKALVLRKELEELKLQKQELTGNEKSERELRYVLKENERLQVSQQCLLYILYCLIISCICSFSRFLLVNFTLFLSFSKIVKLWGPLV